MREAGKGGRKATRKRKEELKNVGVEVIGGWWN
jgi:hypothetical protein